MKENSIEEDIKILEEFKTHGYAMLLMKYEDRNKTNLKIDQAIEHILSDYKRVLKENKQLRTEVNSSKKEYEKYKRLAEMNLKSAEEFKNNMCEHRCLLKSENEILQKENEGLKEYIAIAPNLDEMTATKYRNIQQDAYVQGRAEEQQKTEQIIHENYIPVQKIKDIQKEKEWALQSYDCTKADYKQSQAIGAWGALQELLEGRK